jgi:hypothetical protein
MQKHNPQIDEPNNAGCLTHVVAVVCVPLLPFMWAVHLGNAGVGSDHLAFSLETVVNYTLMTVVVHFAVFLSIAFSVSTRPGMTIPLFLLWIPGILLNALVVFVLWFWNL